MQYNFHEHLSLLPCMYGAWHPYKHTALEVYKAFFPIFAALENCNLQVGAMVYHHRKLLHIEKVVAALLLVGNSVRVRIQALVRQPTQFCNGACCYICFLLAIGTPKQNTFAV